MTETDTPHHMPEAGDMVSAATPQPGEREALARIDAALEAIGNYDHGGLESWLTDLGISAPHEWERKVWCVAAQIRRILAPVAAGLAESRAEVAKAKEFAGLLALVEREHLDLRCIDVPTGGDDSDVAWVVIEHHMAEPREREIGRGATPLAAFRAALAPAQEVRS